MSRAIDEYFSEDGKISSVGIRKNPLYMGILEKYIVENIEDNFDVSSDDMENISDCKKEKYKWAVKNEQLIRENKIFQQIIKQENIQIEDKASKKQTTQQTIPVEVTKELLKMTLISGECYIKNGEVFREEDGALIITKELYNKVKN